jgi:hypothetical protein
MSAIYRRENLVQKKIEASSKFCLPSAVSIPNYATFRLILSGATVPLKGEETNKNFLCKPSSIKFEDKVL